MPSLPTFGDPIAEDAKIEVSSLPRPPEREAWADIEPGDETDFDDEELPDDRVAEELKEEALREDDDVPEVTEGDVIDRTVMLKEQFQQLQHHVAAHPRDAQGAKALDDLRRLVKAVIIVNTGKKKKSMLCAGDARLAVELDTIVKTLQ